MEKINVLSLFDGISCGHIALDKAGISINKYYASEIDKYESKVTNKNYTEGISNTNRYKCIGNGWTVDVIAYILSYLKF